MTAKKNIAKNNKKRQHVRQVSIHSQKTRGIAGAKQMRACDQPAAAHRREKRATHAHGASREEDTKVLAQNKRRHRKEEEKRREDADKSCRG